MHPSLSFLFDRKVCGQAALEFDLPSEVSSVRAFHFASGMASCKLWSQRGDEDSKYSLALLLQTAMIAKLQVGLESVVWLPFQAAGSS